MISYEKFIQSEKSLKELVLYALELVKHKSSTSVAMVSITSLFGVRLNVRSNVLEQLEFNKDKRFVIVVYNKFRKGIVSSNNLSFSSIKNMVQQALEISNYTSIDKFYGLPSKNFLADIANELKVFFPIKIEINKFVQLARNMELSSFNTNSKIINTEGASVTSHSKINVFGNSLGMIQSYKSTLHSFSIEVIASSSTDNKKMERDVAYSIARDFNDLKDPVILGQEAANKAVSRLNSKKIFTTNTNVIFSSEISNSLFFHLSDAITGCNVYRKNTFLINDLNKTIFPEWLNIIEQPHLEKGLFSKPFDAEGVKTKTRQIIQSGVLKTWLLDCYSGRKLGFDTTGHSGGFYNWIISSNTNIHLDRMISDMNQGILITELMGDGVNLINGNYSRGAAGFWIKNGVISHPIKEITISGNLKKIWKSIIYIANDVNINKCIKCGSVLLSNIRISGK